jgi:hypothetical protein
MSQMIKVQEAITLHVNEQNVILTDDGSDMMDLYSFLLMSDHSITLAEFNNQIVQSPVHGQKKPQTYAIRDHPDTDFTLATEDDEDFRLDSLDNGHQSAMKKLNFDDSYSSSIALKNKSLSANYDIDDAERIDPQTFASKGDFIR